MLKYIPKNENENGGGYITEAGRYKFKIDKIEEKFVNGHDVVDIHVSCVETGLQMKDSLHFTEKAEWRVNMFLKACHYPPFERGQGVDIVEETFKGKTFSVDVVMEADNKDPNKFWPRFGTFVIDDYPHESLFLKSEGAKSKSTW